MTTYVWKGLKGKQFLDGTVEALNKNEAAFKLRRDKVIITDLRLSKQQKDGKADGFSLFTNKHNVKVSDKEMEVITRKLATMVSAGLPVLDALKVQIDAVRSPSFKEVLKDVCTGVESGTPLSSCLEVFPKTFDVIFVNLVKAGEASGQMDVFLNKLAESIKYMADIRSKVKSAMVYPSILVFVAIAVTAVMLVMVVPTFQSIFSSAGSELPKPTLIVIAISDFLRAPDKGGVMVLSIFSFLVLFRLLLARSYESRRMYHAFLLKLPLVGGLILESTFSRVAMLQGNLTAAGVPLLESFDIIGTSINNIVIRESLGNIKRGVYSGESVSALYEEEEVFPDLFAQMVSIGEKTGRMEEMLVSISGFYQREFNATVERMTAMLEPIMIVFMGVTIGGLMVAMYLPIFNLGNAV